MPDPQPDLSHLTRITIPDFDVPQGDHLVRVIGHVDDQIAVLDARGALLDALKDRLTRPPVPAPEPEQPRTLADLVEMGRQRLRDDQTEHDAVELGLRRGVVRDLRAVLRR